MDGSGKAGGGGTGAMEVSVATVLMETNDKRQDGTQLVVASELELGYDPQEGAELVVASQQEVIRDTHEGTELVVASQQELRDYAQAELVASSQKELNDKSQVGTLLVVASQQELRDDIEGEAELVAASQKEVNCVALEGAQLVGASQQGFIDETYEETDIVAAHRLEPTGNLQEKSNREGSSQQELNDNVQGTKLACEKDVNDDYNEATEVVIAALKDDSDHNIVGAELVAVLQNEPVNATEEGTEVSAASHRELNDDPEEGPEPGASLKEVTNVDESQEGPDPVAADHEAEEFEEPCPTDGLAKVTSRTTDVCPSSSLPGTANKIPAELLLKDGNSTQVPVSEGRKIKWKDMARRKSNGLASPDTEETQAWIQPAVARKSEPRRRKSIRTNSAANIAIDATQQIPFPHQMFPPLASASPFTQTGKEFLIGAVPVDNADLPTRPLDRLGTELPAVSGKPPRPPSSGHSINFKRGHPSDFTNPPIMQGNRQQEPDYRKELPHELNQASSNYVYPHGLNLPHACRQPLPSANQQFRGPSSLTVPELGPPDDTELPSTRSKRKKSNAGQRPQQKGRNPHKRRLEQMRTQVIKKLKLWGRKSKLIQEDNGAGQSSNDRERLIMGDEQRDVLVKKMVESCRKDPQMRERFLAAVKQLANVGVLNSAARLLMDKDSSGRSEQVINAWKEMHLESAENSSVAVNLYNAVDELHKQSEVAMLKLPCVDDTSLCSLNKTSEGPWELVFPDLGPPNRRTKRNDDRLDEPLRPSKSKNFAPD